MAWNTLKAASSSAFTGAGALSRDRGVTSGVLGLSPDWAGGWLWPPWLLCEPWLPCATAIPQQPSSDPAAANVAKEARARFQFLRIRISPVEFSFDFVLFL